MMTELRDFVMERWQSTYENEVAYNLSESGVHPVSLGNLIELGGKPLLETILLGYGQSNGTQELRAHIAALYPSATPDQVVVTNGSAEANFVALWHLVETGDEIVVVMPTYMQAVGLVESLGGTVKEIWLREDHGWQPDPDEIARVVNDRTRAIVVTNPNNPTGATLGQEARDAILRAAERVGAWILADEVYTGAEISGPETPTLWNGAARVISTGSLSKAYGLAGLRVGWAVAPPELADRIWSRKDYTTISPGELTDRLASIALDPAVRPGLLERTRSYINTGLAMLEKWLQDTGVFTYRRPDAGAILFARYALPIGSIELAERLRAEQSVLIVPGSHFRMDSYLRFGFGIPPETLAPALERVRTVIDQLR